MLTIDTTTMAISMTKSDSATIEFSAKDENGETYLAQAGDVLSFGVSKKYGGDKEKPSGFIITNKFDECFKSAGLTSGDSAIFNADKTSFFTKNGTVYNRCTINDAFDSVHPEKYYINEMWNIEITPDDMTTMKTEDGKEVVDTDKSLKVGSYYWDLQISVNNGEDVYTIIGKTDDIEPKFVLWGEVV